MLAVLLAAAAAGLLVAGPPSGRAAPARRPAGQWPRLLVVLSAAAVGALVLLLDGTALVAGLLGVAAAAGVAVLVRQTRRTAGAERRSERLVEAGELLVGELLAGQPLAEALRRSVSAWPELEPVAAAAALGADVPEAMRRLARSLGAEAMTEVAAAWQLGQGSGMGLSHSLEQVLATTRARQETRRRVRGELASARATARLVAILPAVSLVASQSLGAQPWQFLLGTPAGLGCLGAGLLLAFTGLWWIERIALSVTRETT